MPEGFELVRDLNPSAEAINQLLAACSEPIPDPERWQKALDNSFTHFCILETGTAGVGGCWRKGRKTT